MLHSTIIIKVEYRKILKEINRSFKRQWLEDVKTCGHRDTYPV